MPSCSWPLTSPQARSAFSSTTEPAGKPLFDGLQVHDDVALLERAVDEPALGHAAGERHLAALEDRADLEPLARGVALVALAGGLAVPRADSAADPLSLLALVNAFVYVVKLHQRVTPRRRAISSLVRKLKQRVDRRLDQVELVIRAEALGQDILDPGRLDHGSHRPAGDDAGAWACRHQQHLGGAVRARRRRAESSIPCKWTRCICLWASLTPFSTAGGTSLALP